MINSVTLNGRLVKDVQIRQTTSGLTVGSFVLAVNRPAYNKNDTKANKADFIRCIIWRKAAEVLAKYAHKGSLIGIQGRLETDQYEKDGHTVYNTQVIVNDFSFLGSNKQASTEEDDTKTENTKSSIPENNNVPVYNHNTQAFTPTQVNSSNNQNNTKMTTTPMEDSSQSENNDSSNNDESIDIDALFDDDLPF